jgi:serine/threonine protein kinase
MPCQGLVFMHSHGVAHRLVFLSVIVLNVDGTSIHSDCSLKNILMDATHMYPLGFHPVDDMFLDDLITRAPKITRLEAGVKYYFVDYGISSHFPSRSRRELVLGIAGRDQDVPELSNNVPYDPFKVDIFTIGNVLRGELQAVGFSSPQLILLSHFCVELHQLGIIYPLD